MVSAVLTKWYAEAQQICAHGLLGGNNHLGNLLDREALHDVFLVEENLVFVTRDIDKFNDVRGVHSGGKPEVWVVLAPPFRYLLRVLPSVKPKFVDEKVQGQIKFHLDQIQKDNRIRILFACESGSRAWGFPSPDSDYDVRFVYAHERDWYLSLSEGRDVIEKNLVGDLDIGGWDIRKTLRLMSKSNAVPWEWLQSPIVYSGERDFQKSLWQAATSFYSLKAAFYHYFSLCKRVREETKDAGQVIKSKKYFYILRPLLAAAWIVDRRSIPPMEFGELCRSKRIDSKLQGEIAGLLELKLRSDEKMEIPRSSSLDRFIEATLAECETSADQIPGSQGDLTELDDFFRSIL